MPHSKSSLNILIVGDANVGKSTLFARFMGEEADTEKRTELKTNVKKVECDGEEITVTIMDSIADNACNAAVIRTMQYQDKDAIILVYDISSENSRGNLKQWLAYIRSQNTDCRILLVGNKNDLLGYDRSTVIYGQEAFAKNNGVLFKSISAKHSKKFDEMLQSLVKETLGYQSLPSSAQIAKMYLYKGNGSFFGNPYKAVKIAAMSQLDAVRYVRKLAAAARERNDHESSSSLIVKAFPAIASLTLTPR